MNISLPRAMTTWGIGFLERAAAVVGATLPVTQIEAEMASSFWYCDSRKAERDLGFSPRDPSQTLLDTVKDIRGERPRVKTVTALPTSKPTTTPGGAQA